MEIFFSTQALASLFLSSSFFLIQFITIFQKMEQQQPPAEILQKIYELLQGKEDRKRWQLVCRG